MEPLRRELGDINRQSNTLADELAEKMKALDSSDGPEKQNKLNDLKQHLNILKGKLKGMAANFEPDPESPDPNDPNVTGKSRDPKVQQEKEEQERKEEEERLKNTPVPPAPPTTDENKQPPPSEDKKERLSGGEFNTAPEDRNKNPQAMNPDQPGSAATWVPPDFTNRTNHPLGEPGDPVKSPAPDAAKDKK